MTCHHMIVFTYSNTDKGDTTRIDNLTASTLIYFHCRYIHQLCTLTSNFSFYCGSRFLSREWWMATVTPSPSAFSPAFYFYPFGKILQSLLLGLFSLINFYICIKRSTTFFLHFQREGVIFFVHQRRLGNCKCHAHVYRGISNNEVPRSFGQKCPCRSDVRLAQWIFRWRREEHAFHSSSAAINQLIIVLFGTTFLLGDVY